MSHFFRVILAEGVAFGDGHVGRGRMERRRGAIHSSVSVPRHQIDGEIRPVTDANDPAGPS